MKSLKIALFGALLLGSAPVFAQMQGSDADQFISAVQKRDGSTAMQLIADHPTIINLKDSKGDTPLLIAIGNDDRDWAGFLLNKGADPNISGRDGDTPLIEASKKGSDDVAEWLIGLGARIDEPNKAGETPLIIAVQQRDVRLVKLLLEHGADPDHTDAVAGYSARDYATRDARARDILKLIDAKKPKGSAAK